MLQDSVFPNASYRSCPVGEGGNASLALFGR